MLPVDLKDMLKKAVGFANPIGSFSHPFDEKRLIEFFDACADQGFSPTGKLLDENWPVSTIVGLGGDPANSESVRDGAYRVMKEWTARQL